MFFSQEFFLKKLKKAAWQKNHPFIKVIPLLLPSQKKTNQIKNREEEEKDKEKEGQPEERQRRIIVIKMKDGKLFLEDEAAVNNRHQHFGIQYFFGRDLKKVAVKDSNIR